MFTDKVRKISCRSKANPGILSVATCVTRCGVSDFRTCASYAAIHVGCEAEVVVAEQATVFLVATTAVGGRREVSKKCNG